MPFHCSSPRIDRVTLALCVVAVGLWILASSRLQGLLANTALLAGGALLIAFPLGALLGTAIGKIDLPGVGLLAWLMLGLLFVPLYVQAAAWNGALGAGGWLPRWLAGQGQAEPWLAGWRGAIWVHAMGAVPWIALLTAASLRTVERRLEEEALLDGRPATVLRRVSLRRGLSGLWAGAAWAAVICTTEIAVTDLFQIRTFAEEIYVEANLGSLGELSDGLLHSDLAVGTALAALAVALALRLTTPWLPAAASISADAIWRWRPAQGRCSMAVALWFIIAVLWAPPFGSLVWKAGAGAEQQADGFEQTWSLVKAVRMVADSPWEHRREWGWSLLIGGIAAAATTAVGLGLAWCVRLTGRTWLWGGILAAALAVPAPLWGVWIIGLLNHPTDSPWRALTWLYDRTLLAPALVQIVRTLPIAALWLWAQLASVPSDLLDAARSEGAGPTARLLRVALPIRLPGLAAAAAMAMILAMSELSATLLVLPPGVTVISVRIFQLLHYGVDDRVAALALSVFAVLAMAGGATAVVMRTIRR